MNIFLYLITNFPHSLLPCITEMKNLNKTRIINGSCKISIEELTHKCSGP
jgi:hypothetical protein